MLAWGEHDDTLGLLVATQSKTCTCKDGERLLF